MEFKKIYTPEDSSGAEIQFKPFRNKIFPEKYRSQIGLALRYFPELESIKIRFEEQEQWFPLVSRPDWKMMFKEQRQRGYLIAFSTGSSHFPEHLLFQNLPFNAQIGILGHELCHTVFYKDKTRSELFSIGIKYLFSDYRVKFEKETDRETIRRGLGWQLLEFARFCREHADTSVKIRNWLDKYYLSPEEIKMYMKSNHYD